MEGLSAIPSSSERASPERTSPNIPVLRTRDRESPKGRESTSPDRQCFLSEQNASDVLTRMISLGYLHPDEEPIDPAATSYASLCGDASFEDWRRSIVDRDFRKDNESPHRLDDPGCAVVLTRHADLSERSVLTRERLVREVGEEIEACGGRASLTDLAASLFVDDSDLELAVEQLCCGKAMDVELLGRELVAQSHLDCLAERVNEVMGSEGRASVSELATSLYRFPLDFTLRALTDRMEGGGKRRVIRTDAKMVISSSGAREIRTENFEEKRVAEITDKIRYVVEPMVISDFVKEYDANADAIVEMVRSLCNDGTLRGEVRGDTASAVYAPDIFVERQRKAVDEFFSANGYITSGKCLSLGIATGRMEEYVRESFPDAVCLSGAMMDAASVVGPLEAMVQEALVAETFVDLSSHLPDDLASNEDDVKTILDDIVLPNLDTTVESRGEVGVKGVTLVSDGEALYFSPGMVNRIRTNLLPHLIESYGKAQAEEMDRAEASTKNKKIAPIADILESGEIIMTGAKKKKIGKRMGKKGKQRSDSDAFEEGSNLRDNVTAGGKKKKASKEKRGKKASIAVSDSTRGVSSAAIVPLFMVAKVVAEEYQDLADIQEGYGPLADSTDNNAPKWMEEVDMDAIDKGGPLYKFCRLALDTPDFRDNCARSVQAEYNKITATRQGISLSSRHDCATRIRHIESAFEDSACFPAACHLVQMLAKLPALLLADGGVTSEVMTELEQSFLTGCGANFARRLTEYACFRNDVEEGTFTFNPSDNPPAQANAAGNDRLSVGLPSFCKSVNISLYRFPTTYLSCPNAPGRESKNPLQALREAFPGAAGVELARIWVACGGGCYKGGEKASEDGSVCTRQGSLEDFLLCVEESCL